MTATIPVARRERTLVILKPDAIQRSLMGEIIGRIERVGLKVTAFKFTVPTEEICWKHYAKDDAWYETKGNRIISDRQSLGMPIEKDPMEYGKDIIQTIVGYFTSGPVLALVVEGNRAVDVIKKIVGSTEPSASDVGTIRGDFTLDSYELSSLDERAVRNLVHCSDKPDEAEREIAMWFHPEEVVSYRLVQEQILYDVNLDGILE